MRLILLLLILILVLPHFAIAGQFRDGVNYARYVALGDFGLTANTIYTIIVNIQQKANTYLSGLAILGVVLGGILYMLSLGDESRTATAKRIILYCSLGFAIITIEATITAALISLAGGTSSTVGINAFIINIWNALVWIATTIASLALIYGGILYLTSGGDDQKVAQGKKAIIYSLIGILIMGLSNVIVTTVNNIVINAAGGPPATIQSTLILIVTFITDFIAFISVASLVFGGYTYITAAGSEDKIRRSKTAVISALIGLIIVMLSAALINITLTI